MDPLKDAGPLKGMDRLPDFAPVLCNKDKLCLPLAGNLDLHILVNVPISVTGNSNGLGPVLYIGHNPPNQNGRAKYRSIQDCPDCPIGAFPHFFQIILRHSGGVGGDGCAFHRHTVFLCGIGAVHRHLIICLVPVSQSQIIVLCL